MEPGIDSDTEALWQDMFDLVSKRCLPGSVMAMLRSCSPTSLDSGVLHVETAARSRTASRRTSKSLTIASPRLRSNQPRLTSPLCKTLTRRLSPPARQ